MADILHECVLRCFGQLESSVARVRYRQQQDCISQKLFNRLVLRINQFARETSQLSYSLDVQHNVGDEQNIAGTQQFLWIRPEWIDDAEIHSLV